MFPRGPRFEPQKISDVPGPNSYNVMTDSQLDNYKRGAFLEKTDRFSKDRELDVPGPGAYEVEPKKKNINPNGAAVKPQVQSASLVDRYAILQRKVEDLERVHNDGKKTHQTEVNGLKHEVARYQKTNTEYSDRHDKQKKQIDILESRIQDLKKTAASDNTELKDTRVKLRMSEHERAQLLTKQGEATELKKSLQLLESKRRDEMRERDRRIAELEKTLAGEKKLREFAEGKLQDIKRGDDVELHNAQTTVCKLEVAAAAARAEANQAQAVLLSSEKTAANQEEDLLSQLEQYRSLVARVAEEYGRLAHTTIPIASHTRLKLEHSALQIQMSRLERKLANSSAQVDELAALIRQTNEQNAFLSLWVREAGSEIAFHRDSSRIKPVEDINTSLAERLKSIEDEWKHSQQDLYTIDIGMTNLFSEFYRTACEHLLVDYRIMGAQLKLEECMSERSAAALSGALASHEAIAVQLENVQEEKVGLGAQLKVVTDLADSLKASSESLTRRAGEADQKIAEAAALNDASLKKERDSVRRFTETVQKMRMAEDALRAEIEQLTSGLLEAEKYKDAYYSLSDEIGLLVAKNYLAEDEVQKLSKFNAEIVGHNNPAQRIMYVDRIRRELAEVKHKLVTLGHEREATEALNGDLQNELDMYKSVMVPQDQKPRTAITRVARPPLLNLTHSIKSNNLENSPTSGGKSVALLEKAGAQQVRILESILGDMTIEEIM